MKQGNDDTHDSGHAVSDDCNHPAGSNEHDKEHGVYEGGNYSVSC